MGFLAKFRDNPRQMSRKQEILDHLSRLFNTKRGFGALQKGLGLSSYSYTHARKEIIEQIERDISENIERFEPRVTLLGIEPIQSESLFTLRFRINCLLNGAKTQLSVAFDNHKEMVKVEVAS